MRAKIEELRNQIVELEERNRILREEIETMTYINEEFAKESEEYKKLNERLTKKLGPQEDTNSENNEYKPNAPKR